MKKPFIFFDFGGTLTTGETSMSDVQREPEFYEKMRQLFLENSVYSTLDKTEIVDDLELFTKTLLTWVIEERDRRGADDLEKDPMDMWTEILQTAYQELDSPFGLAAEEASVALEQYKIFRYVRPGVRKAMAKLKSKGYGVGIISNINSRTRVPRELKKFGLEKWFTPVIISSHIGYRKPHPIIYHHAASLAGVPTSECWHVGDMVSRDVLGARRAGFAGVIRITGSKDNVDQRLLDKYPKEYFESDATVDNFSEIEAIVKELHKRRTEGETKAILFTPKAALENSSNLESFVNQYKEQGFYIGLVGSFKSSIIDLFEKLEEAKIGHFWDVIQAGNEHTANEYLELALKQIDTKSSKTVLVQEKGELNEAESIGIESIDSNNLSKLEEFIKS